MVYQVMIPSRLLIIPVLIITTKCQAPKKNSDVIVTYSNHVEAEVPNKIVLETGPSPATEPTVGTTSNEYLEALEVVTKKLKLVTESVEVDEPVQDDVVFLPNDREHERNEDILQNERMSFGHIMGYKTMDDVMKNPISTTTDKTQEDIIFVAGKNHEIEDKPEKERPSNKGTYVDAPYGEEVTEQPRKIIRLNCKNLDCNNTVQSVCGGKVDSMKWRYRLFLNECYFRKVNCNFRNSENRFKEVDLQYCKNVAMHQSKRPEPKPLDKFISKPVQVDNTRRSTSSRRSMSMDVDGRYCSHACPVSCPEDYEPECAVSGRGEYRMFLNHCKMDLNSCSYGLVWRKRPMAECVGGKKADMRQNRGFIDWMQRVGIVDNKGRLALS